MATAFISEIQNLVPSCSKCSFAFRVSYGLTPHCLDC